ncbi:MAG: AMP-binding protein [Planctomycetota bacterium]|nr:AMP-binding protein [Planctomycetota bacterium]MDA1213548.1 AMP-binding protein [Planctomycetota bacterium]
MTKTVPWVDGITIGHMLRKSAAVHADREAVVFPDAAYRLTYRQFDDEVDRVAKSLIAMGIRHGEHVAVWGTNWPEWLLMQFATARIGAVMVTINPAYRTSELSYVLKQSDAVALFLIDKFRKSNYLEMVTECIAELKTSEENNVRVTRRMVAPLASAEFSNLRQIVVMKGKPLAGMIGWRDFLDGGQETTDEQLAERESACKPGDAINIQYTSGTTGFPKGATLTHRNLLLNAFWIADCMKLSEIDRMCVPVPFYHCFGCVLGVLCAAITGATLMIPAEHFDAEATLRCIAAEEATVIYGVPTMFIAMLNHPTFDSEKLTSLRTGIMAGSPCPIEIMKRVVDDMGASEITIAYGLTEASPVITQTRTDDPIELRVTTVGRPLPDLQVKLVDPANGDVLGDNQQGELCTFGHGVMLGYYNMPEATAAAIDADGWLHSGDLAIRLPNGYYKITGRIKDMICRGGENIYPREIEEFLLGHPAIQDVAVVGIPDQKYVEEIAAWIKLKAGVSLTEDELRSHCKDKLAHFKIPKFVRFVDSFPQTVTGKIQKYKIREIMIDELGLDDIAKTSMA